MTAQNFKVLNFLLCDDIKQERNGNYILLSPRTSATKSESFPVGVDQTVAYLEIDTEGKIVKGFHIGIFDTSGKLMGEAKTTFVFADWHLPAALAVRLPAFTVQNAGVYRCKIKELQNDDWHEVYQFSVSQASATEASLPHIPQDKTEEFRQHMAAAAQAFIEGLESP